MPPVNAAAFREALSHFASGVTVVTARAGDEGSVLVGFTATSFASVSLAPPLVLVCVAHTASTHRAFLRAKTFGVSVLGEGQSWLAEQFARKNVDRFAGVRLVGDRDTPLIEGAIARLACRPHTWSEIGDHTVVFGEVLAADVDPGKPLLYFARRFGTLSKEEEAPEPLGVAVEGGS